VQYWLAIGRPATLKQQPTTVESSSHGLSPPNASSPHGEQQLILWSQPEIVLYDTLRDTHPGYPDLFQDPEDEARIVSSASIRLLETSPGCTRRP